jgi:hypothetical protein
MVRNVRPVCRVNPLSLSVLRPRTNLLLKMFTPMSRPWKPLRLLFRHPLPQNSRKLIYKRLHSVLIMRSTPLMLPPTSIVCSPPTSQLPRSLYLLPRLLNLIIRLREISSMALRPLHHPNPNLPRSLSMLILEHSKAFRGFMRKSSKLFEFLQFRIDILSDIVPIVRSFVWKSMDATVHGLTAVSLSKGAVSPLSKGESSRCRDVPSNPLSDLRYRLLHVSFPLFYPHQRTERPMHLPFSHKTTTRTLTTCITIIPVTKTSSVMRGLLP